MRFRITNSELRLLADEIVKFPPTVYVTEGQSINTSRKNFCKADIKMSLFLNISNMDSGCHTGKFFTLKIACFKLLMEPNMKVSVKSAKTAVMIVILLLNVVPMLS